MSRILPPNRPQQPRATSLAYLARHGVDITKPAFLAMRSYFEDSMGVPDQNDRGIYDDAIFLVTPDQYLAFNANTDPSVFRKGIATLVPGVYPYRLGWHKRGKKGEHLALRPATRNEELPVTRDGILDPEPGVAINLHRGSLTSTSSEGCQTVHPHQWEEFYKAVSKAMKRFAMPTIPYCLIEQQG